MTAYDEASQCLLALCLLREMVQIWFQDIHSYANIFADIITVQTGTLNDGVNLRLSILTRQHLHYRLSATAEDGQHIRFKSITSITLNQNGTINENNDRHLNTVLLKIAD
ncbi:unnamed protein product [Rotaria sp. Silwood2]|nr:unnamed protein product [Rotaria sp. Silwood2]